MSDLASHFPDNFPERPIEEQRRILIEIIRALPAEQMAELWEGIDLKLKTLRKVDGGKEYEKNKRGE